MLPPETTQDCTPGQKSPGRFSEIGDLKAPGLVGGVDRQATLSEKAAPQVATTTPRGLCKVRKATPPALTDREGSS